MIMKLTCWKEEAGDVSFSSDFHSRSIWWTCSSRSVASIVRLSFLANWRSMNMPCKSSTRFLALSLNSLCETDLQLLFEPFLITNTLPLFTLKPCNSQNQTHTHLRLPKPIKNFIAFHRPTSDYQKPIKIITKKQRKKKTIPVFMSIKIKKFTNHTNKISKPNQTMMN